MHWWLDVWGLWICLAKRHSFEKQLSLICGWQEQMWLGDGRKELAFQEHWHGGERRDDQRWDQASDHELAHWSSYICSRQTHELPKWNCNWEMARMFERLVWGQSWSDNYRLRCGFRIRIGPVSRILDREKLVGPNLGRSRHFQTMHGRSLDWTYALRYLPYQRVWCLAHCMRAKPQPSSFLLQTFLPFNL